LAIGPIHHSIDLISARNGNHCGKMVCNILFTQVQDAKIELIECEAFLIDQEDHVKKADYYSVQFGVTTFNEVYESTKSTTHHFERQKPKANSL
jgi:hypothetical protein